MNDWTKERKHSENTDYLCPDLNNERINESSAAEAANYKQRLPEGEIFLINFPKSRFEKLQDSLLNVLVKCNPEKHITLKCFEKESDASIFFKPLQPEPERLLHDENRFLSTRRYFQGRTIFMEIETGKYWYLDNLHKNHFEVFNAEKCHIGEADLDGKPREGTRDAGKDTNFRRIIG